MDNFSIVAENGHLIFYYNQVIGFPDKVSPFGGYDVNGQLEIKCNNYFVKGKLKFTTGEIYNFFTQLKQVYSSLNGIAQFDSFESQLLFTLRLHKLGHTDIVGEYSENLFSNTKLKFELLGDQTYLSKCIDDNKIVIDKFGDYQGVVKKAL
jgi:hypothetical protein